MTDEQWIELGKRAVACKGWRWMPGMLARYKGDAWCRVTDADSFGLPTRVRLPNPRRAWPDFRDPATVGCLLALVREAWGCHVHLRRWASPAPDMSGKDRSTWEPVDGLGRRLVAGPRVLCESEVAALVAALEAADD